MLLVARWAFYAAFAIAVLYAVWSYRAEILAALRDMIAAWRDFWRGLFGAKKPRVAGLASEMPPDLPQAPFSSYADPFVTGIASRCSAEELIRYSFQAFEAWSAEHGCPRLADRTPHELAHDVGRQHDFIRQEARGLAELYAVVAYARSGLPRDTANQLERLWRQMRAHVAAESWTAN